MVNFGPQSQWKAHLSFHSIGQWGKNAMTWSAFLLRVAFFYFRRSERSCKKWEMQQATKMQGTHDCQQKTI